MAAQVPLFLLAANATGWALYATAVLFMLFVFGAIPFIDTMIVQYVNDRMRSRVSGMRLAVSFGVSALAVYILGPVVKAAGFTVLLTLMAGISALSTLFVSLLPGEAPTGAPAVEVTLSPLGPPWGEGRVRGGHSEGRSQRGAVTLRTKWVDTFASRAVVCQHWNPDRSVPFSPERMAETLVLLVSSFWLGAVHAATPGHGKTIAAAYIVGARGRPVDALVLGIFVTLSHTSGIVLVAVLASLGSAWLIPHRVEAYLAFATGLLVIAIGAWMLVSQRAAFRAAAESAPRDHEPTGHGHHHPEGGPEHEHHHHGGGHAHDHEHPPDPRKDAADHPHVEGSDLGYHRHGWGRRHTHRLDVIAENPPSLAVLLGLGIAGGLLPDPGALAILLAAIASGRVILGLFTVVVFSIGFASVLVVVGVVAARVGQIVLTWLQGRWVAWVQSGAALVIVGVGVVLTAVAWRTLARLP